MTWQGDGGAAPRALPHTPSPAVSPPELAASGPGWMCPPRAAPWTWEAGREAPGLVPVHFQLGRGPAHMAHHPQGHHKGQACSGPQSWVMNTPPPPGLFWTLSPMCPPVLGSCLRKGPQLLFPLPPHPRAGGGERRRFPPWPQVPSLQLNEILKRRGSDRQLPARRHMEGGHRGQGSLVGRSRAATGRILLGFKLPTLPGHRAPPRVPGQDPEAATSPGGRPDPSQPWRPLACEMAARPSITGLPRQ